MMCSARQQRGAERAVHTVQRVSTGVVNAAMCIMWSLQVFLPDALHS